MVAVTAFVGGHPRSALAFGTGVRWGVGHAVALMAAGGLLAWTGLTLPEAAGLWMEMGVGVLLISVGIWVVRTASRLHVHGPPKHDGHAHLHAHEGSDHSHSHVHSSNSHFRHRHLTTLVGAFHGLAGTAPLVALLPVTMISDIWAAFGYLAAFGLGTTVSMGVYGAIAAATAQRAAVSSASAHRLAVATAVASIGVGVWWIVRSIPALSG